MMGLLLLISVIHCCLVPILAQEPKNYDLERQGNDLMWCVISLEELAKCQALANAVDEAQKLSEVTFGSYYRKILCKHYTSKNECMKLIDEGLSFNPNIMTVDAGEVFVGGRYHSLVPILKEVYDNNQDYYYSIAVVKKGSLPYVNTMSDLRDTKACFPRVGSLAGWTIPIHTLMQNDIMPIVDCNNHVKSAIEFFGTSCAVNSLQDRYNPLGENPHKFCELCGSATPGIRCTNRDPYAGYSGALLCLKEKGDVAFLNEKAMFNSGENLDDFELLCPQPLTDEYGRTLTDDYGRTSISLGRMPVTSYKECNWGVAPGNVMVVSSAMDLEERYAVQLLMDKLIDQFGIYTPPTPIYGPDPASDPSTEYEYNLVEDTQVDEAFKLFESAPKYGLVTNLLFDDSTRSFAKIQSADMSYKTFLGNVYGDSTTPPFEAINGVRKCPVGTMTLCVTSEAEMIKCVRMRTALNAQLLEPKMVCKRATTSQGCMKHISNRDADVTVLEAGDIYKAGWQYKLVPIMAEVYNLGEPYYYAVAVTKQRDNNTELIYLKNKRTCHPAVGHGGGWVMPMAWLLTNERVRDYGCDSLRAASEYFSEACAPGAQSDEYQNRYQADYWEHSHLCDLCHGSARHYCKRNHMEDYYGHTGAFRCLVEGGGNVAFIKHTTVTENCDGKRKEWWARNQLTSDYELLCRDGTRKSARSYEDCYLGKVKANAIVTDPRIGGEKLNAFINLFKYSQQHYGQKVPDQFSFSMFYSEPPYADLIFQDATQQLIVLPPEERDYTKYLDREFLKAYEVVECRSTGNKLHYVAKFNVVMVVISIILFL